jgi:hypothetical protein
VTTPSASYWSGDEPLLAPTPGEQIGAPSEMLPAPEKSGSESKARSLDDASDNTRRPLDLEVPELPSPPVDLEPIPMEAAPAAPATPEDLATPELDGAMPAAPGSVAPETAPSDAAPPGFFGSEPAAYKSTTRPTTSARERFRRAAVAVHINEPSSAQ